MTKNPVIILVLIILILLTHTATAGDLQQGLEYYKKGDYKRAESYFRSLIAKEPSNYSAQYMLAASLVNLQKYNEAKKIYRNVIINSSNKRIVSLSRTGLTNLGEHAGYSSATRAVINISSSDSVMIVNNVRLNDRISAKFVFDTGATYTTISKATASRLNISTLGAPKMKIMTGSGHITAPLIKIPKIEVKGLAVKNVETIVLDLPESKIGNNDGVVGLLGLSFLEKFKITVDRSNGQITLEKN